MPTQAQLALNEEIREYFRQHLAHKVRNIEEAREDIQNRFRLHNSRWYYVRDYLKHILGEYQNQPQRGTLTPAVVTESTPEPQGMVVELPMGVDGEAKAAINKLLEENYRLNSELSSRDVELSGSRRDVASAQSRIRLLKNMVKQLVEEI